MDLLARMRRNRLMLVVASSAKKQELLALFRIAGVDRLVEESTSSDDAGRSKLDPDVVRVALVNSGARLKTF
jgi:beta-phosphoglucomutase-like phosphatase (HAD superfamily)